MNSEGPDEQGEGAGAAAPAANSTEQQAGGAQGMNPFKLKRGGSSLATTVAFSDFI